MRKIAGLIVVLNLLVLTVLGMPVLGETEKDDNTINRFDYSLYQEDENNVSEPLPINLYLYDGDGGALGAEVPVGNSSTEVDCNGHPAARWVGYYIGSWTSAPITMPLTLDTQFSCSLWVYSSQGASNVHFNVEIEVNGNEIFQFMTESMSASQAPVEIKGDVTRENPVELSTGDTFGVRLAYFSDPALFVGPGSDSKLIVGSDEFDSHIKVTTSPMYLSVNTPMILDDLVTFSATFIDAFSASRLDAHIKVDGIVEAVSISEPLFTMGANGSLVSWDWNFKTDKAQDGEYKVTVFICYGDENDFQAWGSYLLEFHEHESADDIFSSLGILFPIIIIAIIAVVAVIVVKVILNRRALKNAI